MDEQVTMKGRFMIKKVLISLLLLGFSATSVFAADEVDPGATSTIPQHRELVDKDEAKPHFGITAGVANPEGSYDSRGEYGIDVGYQPYIPVAIGLMASYHETEAGPGTLLEQT